MTTLRLYDTAAREKRVFAPREADRITMYLCGPTVYGRAHIGNARPAVVFDVLARLLRHLYPDHRLDYARNVTDVDDKIIAAAEIEGVDPSVITERFEHHYLEDTMALGVEPPPLQPRATAHVPDMITMISRLVDGGHAYAAEGHVLFSVASDPAYGSLSRRDADAMRAGARVEVAPYKRDPSDFVLWKPSAADVIGWDSPWGRGRPGWHIECSAMIERLLGVTIDIHAGGLDLIFPHHENEAAQSRSAHAGAPLANHWLHNGFVAMGGGTKMSKSVGNVVTMEAIAAQGRRGPHLRYALLSAHYRQPLEWDDDLIDRAQRTMDRWSGALRGVSRDGGTPHASVVEALADDLNTPEALAALGALARAGDWPAFAASAALLGLDVAPAPSARGTFEGRALDDWVESRRLAKAARDFTEADRIRGLLERHGVTLEDGPDGTTATRLIA